ncbi:hypothetical protein ABS767_08800 [Sphingomonas sp. ST-64]|uniref:Uncharacterized protein n=1 Tax=Sphingomonas plantiphila TaxID=3163295 RepID=A0ABW8YNP3_9SPHN
MAEGTTTQRGWFGRALIWVFAAVGLLAAIAVIGLAMMIAGIGEWERPRRDAPVAVKGQKSPFSVQDIRDVRGTGLIQLAIGIPGRVSPGASSSGRYDFDHRNLILLDKATGASRKLLPDNGRSIMEFRFLPAVAAVDGAQRQGEEYVVEDPDEPDGKSAPPAAYYVLAVAQADRTKQDVLVGNIADGRQAFLLKDIDGIDRMWMLTPTRLAMVVREGMAVHYKVIDVPALKIVLARPVEIG